MSELTNIHARAAKDLTTPTSLPADPNALDQVKLVAGNFPPEYAGNEALTLRTVKELAAHGREAELEEVFQKITQEETRAKAVENSLIQNKAEKTYVDSELEAQNNEVNAALSQLNTAASKYYSTLAEANQQIAYIGANQLIYVGNNYSGEEGLYYKPNVGSSNLVKSNYDPLTKAKADATTKANNALAEAVGFSLSDIAAEKKGNLLDASMFTPGNLQTSGVVNTSAAVSYTQNYIPMNDFSKYVLETSAGTALPGGAAICFYDKNKNLISGTILQTIPAGSQIVVPPGTYFMRTSCATGNLPTFRISVTPTETIKYQAAEADATAKANNAVAESVEFSLSDIAAEKRGNLLDASMFTSGYLQTSGVVITSGTLSYTQNYIPMNEFSKYVLETSAGTSLHLGPAICFYDKNKNIISGTILYNIPVGSQIVVPSGTYFMRTTCSNANLPMFRISVTTTETTKANAVQQAAEADATAKANAVKSYSESYTDSIVSAIDFGTPVMTGQAMFDKSLSTNKGFSAVWSEYNKPVWHIGNSVFVDAVGATVKVVKQEFVMTYKLTQDNQTVRVPTVSKDSSTTYVDWGDGTGNYVNKTNNLHTYTNAIGDEFVITITGELEVFDVPLSYDNNRTAECIKSIDKNTLPKTTSRFNVRGCINLESLCDGAFSSLAGDSLNLELYKNAPNVTYTSELFKGLQHVKNIDNLLGLVSGVNNAGVVYSPELFKYFTSVTSAKSLFANYKGPLTKEHLEAMTELQYAYRLFGGVEGINSSDILTHQTKLIDVNQCFYLAKSGTVSALPIYQHLLNNNPNLTNYVGCFQNATLQDMGSIPTEWK